MAEYYQVEIDWKGEWVAVKSMERDVRIFYGYIVIPASPHERLTREQAQQRFDVLSNKPGPYRFRITEVDAGAAETEDYFTFDA